MTHQVSEPTRSLWRVLTTFGTAVAASFVLVACGGSTGMGGGGVPPVELDAALTGDQEVARPPTGAIGDATFTLDEAARTIAGSVSVDGVVPTAAHLHLGAAGTNGGIEVPLVVRPYGADLAATPLTDSQVADILAGNYYVNVHSTDFPMGEIRGQLGREVYAASLSGPQETAQTASTASGTGRLVLDPVTRNVSGGVELTGISATAAHVHTGAPGVNGGIVFTLVDSGDHQHFSMPTGTTLTDDQVQILRQGGWYFNAHSADFPMGAIRGQIGQRMGIANATGTQEVPPVISTATATGRFQVDPRSRTLAGTVTLSGITASAVHVHAGAVGVAGPVQVGLAPTSDANVWVVPASTVLTADQMHALLTAGLYFNVHSTAHPTGELRGQIQPQ